MSETMYQEIQRLKRERDEAEYLVIEKLAAISTAATCNTQRSIEEQGIATVKPGHHLWTAAYADVCEAVRREMRHRAELDELREWKRTHSVKANIRIRAETAEARVAELEAALREYRDAEWQVTHDWGGDRLSMLERVDAALDPGPPSA